jgi:methyl-accepting chemotaxis protein
MSPQQKRKVIAVVSFSAGDLAKSHLAMLAMSAVMVLGAATTGWVGVVNGRVAASEKNAANSLNATASMVEQGAKTYITGGAQRLAAAAAGGGATNDAINDMNVTQLGVLQGLKEAAATGINGWGTVSGALGDALPSITAAATLSDAVGGSAASFAQLAKDIQASGQSDNVLKREYESVVRLYSYAEGGFGAASVPRVDYDLRVLVAGLGSSTFKTEAGFVAPLAVLSGAAVAKPMPKDAVSHLADGATAGKAAAQTLTSGASSGAETAQWLFLGAGALAIAAIILAWVGLMQVLADFGNRFHAAVQKFRGDEEGRAALLAQLRRVVEGETDSIELRGSSEDVNAVASLVNTVLENRGAQIEEAQSSRKKALQVQSSTLVLIDAAQDGYATAAANIERAIESLDGATALSRLVQVDTRAASQSAYDAASHSSNAGRMAQDAASRVEALREGLQETSKGVKRLGERTQEINSVVDTLDGISEQMGVLALNANLEAERAGEMGAGFALVALEVRNLAVRSSGALERISGLVAGAQADARAAAESVDRSTSQIVSGSNIAAVSQALLVAVSPMSTGIGAMTDSIAETGAESEAVLLRAKACLVEARAMVKDSSSKVTQAQEPLRASRARLELVGEAQ